MTRSIGLLILIAVSINVIAGDDFKTINGIATYRERIALPPRAIFEAVLEDTSLADALATRMGEVRIEAPRIPIQFAIPYHPGLIQKGHSYTLRATIRIDGKLWFTTDTSYRVLQQSGDDRVDLLLRRVAQSTGGGQPASVKKHLGILPARFSGVLPCADCPGIDHRLVLFPDHHFSLTMAYLERSSDAGRELRGRWALSDDGLTLWLYIGSEIVKRFAVTSPRVLRLLDRRGKAIESSLNYELRRTSGSN